MTMTTAGIHTAAVRLPVLATVRPQQDCTACALQAVCWRPTEPRVRVINLLVCRLERGIAVDGTMRTLLELLHKRLVRLALWVVRRARGYARLDAVEVRQDLESAVFTGLRTSYVMGEGVGPLRWLFGRTGCVRREAHHILRRAKQDARVLRYGSTSCSAQPTGGRTQAAVDLESEVAFLNAFATDNRIRTPPPALEPYTPTQPEAQAEYIQHALEVVDDGVTLTLEEYRVLRFCLAHASKTRRTPVEGLLVRYSEVVGLRLQCVQETYTLATRHLADAVGLGEVVQQTRHVGHVDESVRRRRAAFRAQAPVNSTAGLRLSREEILAIVLPGEAPTPTVVDLAWALGVTPRVVYRHRARWAGRAPEDIVQALAGDL